MRVTPVRTDRITRGADLRAILERYLPTFSERSVLAITSKIVSITQGRVAKIGAVQKHELVEQEADYYLPESVKYHIMLTIKENILIPMAGIDESNGGGYYVLWPRNAQETANRIRAYLVDRFGLKEVGVIIADSKTTPLRWGTTGIALAHSGFKALKNYVGKPDLFGRKLKVTKSNQLDGLTAAAVAVMGEGDEQTPLAVIEELPFVRFQRRNPTKRELASLQIPLDEDLYAPLLNGVRWIKAKTPLRAESGVFGSRTR